MTNILFIDFLRNSIDENIRNYEDEQFMAIQFIKELDVIIDMITNGATDDIDAYIEEL